eukprot:365119-Chlamydomonas_euryale.AAC.11
MPERAAAPTPTGTTPPAWHAARRGGPCDPHGISRRASGCRQTDASRPPRLRPRRGSHPRPHWHLPHCGRPGCRARRRQACATAPRAHSQTQRRGASRGWLPMLCSTPRRPSCRTGPAARNAGECGREGSQRGRHNAVHHVVLALRGAMQEAAKLEMEDSLQLGFAQHRPQRCAGRAGGCDSQHWEEFPDGRSFLMEEAAAESGGGNIEKPRGGQESSHRVPPAPPHPYTPTPCFPSSHLVQQHRQVRQQVWEEVLHTLHGVVGHDFAHDRAARRVCALSARVRPGGQRGGQRVCVCVGGRDVDGGSGYMPSLHTPTKYGTYSTCHRCGMAGGVGRGAGDAARAVGGGYVEEASGYAACWHGSREWGGQCEEQRIRGGGNKRSKEPGGR